MYMVCFGENPVTDQRFFEHPAHIFFTYVAVENSCILIVEKSWAWFFGQISWSCKPWSFCRRATMKRCHRIHLDLPVQASREASMGMSSFWKRFHFCSLRLRFWFISLVEVIDKRIYASSSEESVVRKDCVHLWSKDIFGKTDARETKIMPNEEC